MKTWSSILTIVVFLATATAVASAASAPFTPPPATGVQSPLNSDRLAAPAALPAQAVIPCAGETNLSLVMNGASVPRVGPAPHGRALVQSKVMNGASVEVPTMPGVAAPLGWCEGAYRADLGSNFAPR